MNSDDHQILSILQNCDKEQLDKYLNDDHECELLIKTLDSYQSLISERQFLDTSNRSMAESNLSMEPLLESLKAKLKLEIDEFERAKREYLSLKETYEAQTQCGDDLSLASVLSTLQVNAQRAEEDTDRMAEDFFCNYVSVHTDEELNTFQRQFLEARTQAHLVKIKAEKLKELCSSDKLSF